MNITGFAGKDFDADTYIRILVSITKSDRDNGLPEYNYVRRQALFMGVNFDDIWDETAPSFSIGNMKVSRTTALAIIKESLIIASLDSNLTLYEKSKIYEYAEKLNFRRADVDFVEEWLREEKTLKDKWDGFVRNGD